MSPKNEIIFKKFDQKTHKIFLILQLFPQLGFDQILYLLKMRFSFK